MALDILFIVSNTLTPHADEQAMEALLTGRGDTITRAANTSSPPSPSAHDLIVIGRTMVDAGVVANWRDLAAPILAMRDIAWAGLDMATAATGTGSTFTVTDALHPISVAAGLTAGSNTIYSASDVRGQGQSLGSGATSIGYGFNAEHHVVIAYETGAAMQTVSAPARRVGNGFTAASTYNALGQSLFFACVDWAAGAIGGDTDPPTLSNATASATGPTTASGSVDTDEAGTASAILTQLVTPPTPEQIEAGTDAADAVAIASDLANAVAAPGTVPFTYAGITQGLTGLYQHATVRDAAGNASVSTFGPFDMPQVVSATLPAPEPLRLVLGALSIEVDRTVAGRVTQNGEGLTAAVYLLNRRTLVAREEAADGNGDYSFADVAPGTYTVQAVTDDGMVKGYAEVEVT